MRYDARTMCTLSAVAILTAACPSADDAPEGLGSETSETTGSSTTGELPETETGVSETDTDPDSETETETESETETEAESETETGTESDTDTGEPMCGDGIVEGDEQCDDQNADDTDACLSTCVAASCGDGFVWADNEECDDGGLQSGDGCDDTCMYEGCVFDVDAIDWPVSIYAGTDAHGQITFDAHCDLLVPGGIDAPGTVFRVSHLDGSVSTAVEGLGGVTLVTMAYRELDERVYVFTGGPSRLYALDPDDQVELLYEAPLPFLFYPALTVAPEGFGDFGGQLIASFQFPEDLVAIDVDVDPPAITSLLNTPLASKVGDLAFDPAGTLYVTQYDIDRVSTVSADGDIEDFINRAKPDGVAPTPDGASIYVAYDLGGGEIERLSIPDAEVLDAIEYPGLHQGYAASGMVVDGAGNLLYVAQVEGEAVLQVVTGP